MWERRIFFFFKAKLIAQKRLAVKNGFPEKLKFIKYGEKKIISEKLAKKIRPDYYFVLPWHFKKFIIQKEKKLINKGTKFIFPLPRLRIY